MQRMMISRAAPGTGPGGNIWLGVLAALASCFVIVAIGNLASREVAIAAGLAIILAAGQAMPRVSGASHPTGAAARHGMAVPAAMLLFAILKPLFD